MTENLEKILTDEDFRKGRRIIRFIFALENQNDIVVRNIIMFFIFNYW